MAKCNAERQSPLLAVLLVLVAGACGRTVEVPGQPSAGDGGDRDPDGAQGSVGDDGGISASSSGGSGGEGVTCVSACAPGQICCFTMIVPPPGVAEPPGVTTSCLVGPCPSTPGFGPRQLCSTAAECFTRGDTCGPPRGESTIPVMICSAPIGDGG